MYRERMDGNNMPALHTAGLPHDVSATMAAMSVRGGRAKSVLDRRLEFERAHPEVVISLPWNNESGLWEAAWPGGRAGYDTCEGLLNHLDAEFAAEAGE